MGETAAERQGKAKGEGEGKAKREGEGKAKGKGKVGRGAPVGEPGRGGARIEGRGGEGTGQQTGRVTSAAVVDAAVPAKAVVASTVGASPDVGAVVASTVDASTRAEVGTPGAAVEACIPAEAVGSVRAARRAHAAGGTVSLHASAGARVAPYVQAPVAKADVRAVGASLT